MAMNEKAPRSTTLDDKPTTQLDITKEILEEFLYGKREVRLVDVQQRKTLKRKGDGMEEGGSRKHQSVWCEECCTHVQGKCHIHQSTQAKLSYAISSFPPEVRLCTSSIPEYTYGACAAKAMPRGTWIGPYEGRRVYSPHMPKDKDNAYVWEIYDNGKFSHFIDGSDESISSWMRFIRCARHKLEQNMTVIQYGQNIFYCATRDIEIGEEMLVWYHESYYQFWGVPLVLTEELSAKHDPPIPQGIPLQMEVIRRSTPNQPAINASPVSHAINGHAVTSPRSLNPPEIPIIPHAHGTHKSCHPPSSQPKLVYPSVAPQSQSKSVPSDSSISPVGRQHPSPGVLPYPPMPPIPRQYLPTAPYPPLSKGSIPYPPPPAKNAMPYPTMLSQSVAFAYPPLSKYPSNPPDIVLYQQPLSSQYQARPSQSSPILQMPSQAPFHEKSTGNIMTPPNVQVLPGTRRSSMDKPAYSSVPTPLVLSTPQRLASTQMPQLSPGVQITNAMTSNIPHAEQQPNTRCTRADKQPPIQSPREQAMRSYYETITIDRSSTSSETDQWITAEVKENMPLGSMRDNGVIDTQLKNSKHPQALKTSPLQNLTPSIHNNRPTTIDQDKQHNQVSSTVRNMKEQDISWKCGQCGEMFAQQVTLRMHVCSKAADNPFHCGHCSNTFATSLELRDHVVTHSNDRPFKCGFCGRSFAGATTLGNHMRTHTGQRPYECKVCGQTFAIATQLSRHLKPPGECGLKQKDLNSYNQSVDITVEQ